MVRNQDRIRTMNKTKKEEITEHLPEERRSFLRKAVKAGIIVPAVATFSMSGLMVRPASAQANFTS
jgi:hypothetical protein